MPEALEEPITAIIEAVCSVIERTPPELIGDILHHGIVMTGGGSLLYGLDRLIESVTGVKTRVAKNAISCVAIGTGKYLDFISAFPDDGINLPRHLR
jgi:rod shape-determining protein MreB